jgi:hypothetical protein
LYFTESFKTIGYKPIPQDPGILKNNENIVCIHVDDALTASQSETQADKVTEGLTKIYGINSLDKQLTSEKFLPLNNSHQPFISDVDKAYTFNIYGVSFHFGDCCEKINNFGDICKSMYVSTIPNSQLSYCRYHYKEGLKKYKISEKNKMMNQKMLLIVLRYF